MHVLAIPKIPEIKPQDDIASIIAGAISLAQIEINDGDIKRKRRRDIKLSRGSRTSAILR